MEVKRPRMESVAVTEEGGLGGFEGEDLIDRDTSYEPANNEISDGDDGDSVMDTR